MFRLSWTEEFFVLLTTLQLSKSEVGLVLEDPLNVPPVLLRLATSPILTFTLRFPSHQRVHLALKHHHIIESIIYKMFIHQLIQIQNYCRMQNIDTTPLTVCTNIATFHLSVSGLILQVSTQLCIFLSQLQNITGNLSFYHLP